jgi:hypothetical protein
MGGLIGARWEETDVRIEWKIDGNSSSSKKSCKVKKTATWLLAK